MCDKNVRFVHKLSEAEFADRLISAYGADSLSVRAYDYVRKHMCAERGYIRRYTGEDYFVHPQAVAEILMDHVEAGDSLIAVALLHDCIEDLPDGTEAELLEQFGEDIVYRVRLLSKKDGDALAPYLDRILSDRDATLVKLADRMNNNSTYGGATREEKRQKTEETKRFYVPVAEDAEKKDPENTAFYKTARAFFGENIEN